MSTRQMNPSDEQSWIGYLLKFTQNRLRLRLEAELAGTGVSPSQNAVLLAIAENPRISNAALARAAFVTPQSMQGMLVTLEREGLITRTPHPEHGRIIMTELTDAGKRAAQAGTIAAEIVEREMLAGLSAGEASMLRELLQRCADALGEGK
ncbi:MAG TPA: MarR family transcriptional regulator [Sphingomonadaceae bacterium]|nr:MarR family transcriptional regulator [Sphingomonadaceae bacterium]